MAEVEIASLQREVARLNQIITVLLEQNEVLKARIAIAEKTNSPPNLLVAVAENINGNTDVQEPLSKKTNPPLNVSIAIAENINGNTDVQEPLSKKTNPPLNVSVAVAENINGNTNVQQPLNENVRSPAEVLAPVVYSIPFTNSNVSRLKAYFRSHGFNKVRETAIANAAKLLLHFYNKGNGGYPELRKLTGLSKYGLAKYLGSLKRRGLIERDGWQQFRVTGFGVSCLKNACAHTPVPGKYYGRIETTMPHL
jgi:hypothetical protein